MTIVPDNYGSVVIKINKLEATLDLREACELAAQLEFAIQEAQEAAFEFQGKHTP